MNRTGHCGRGIFQWDIIGFREDCNVQAAGIVICGNEWYTVNEPNRNERRLLWYRTERFSGSFPYTDC